MDGRSGGKRPARLTRRQLFYRVHLWLGLTLAAYFVMLGISGSLLVFGRELDAYLNADILTVTPRGELKPVSAIVETFHEAHPDLKLGALAYPKTPDGVFTLKVGPTAPSQLHIHVDPYTAEVVGERTLGSFLYGFLVCLHFNLLLGPPGRTLNGWGTLLVMALLGSGLFLWWPGAKATRHVWKARLSVRADAGRSRFLYDIHNAVGVYPLAFSLIFTLTALEFAFPNQVRPFLHALAGSRSAHTPVEPPSGGEQSGPTTGPPLSLDALLTAADAASDGRLSSIEFPKGDGEPLVVTKALEDYTRIRARVEIAMDAQTGRIVSIHDSRREALGSALVRWCVPLHYGIWGGLPMRLLYVLLGLGPLAAIVTGFWKWRLRVTRQKRLFARLDALGAPAPSRA